jgi:hypothetical protein
MVFLESRRSGKQVLFSDTLVPHRDRTGGLIVVRSSWCAQTVPVMVSEMKKEGRGYGSKASGLSYNINPNKQAIPPPTDLCYKYATRFS